MRTLTQHLLPHKIVSKIADLSANCEVTWIKNFLINYFIQRYAVKMHEAIQEDPFAYTSYNKFFTRQLKPQFRPIDSNPLAIISPADGALAQFGKITENQIMQAKGHTYSVQDLLANDSNASHFINGTFATVYLAPKDYHRVHMPLGGRLIKMIYVPGKLFSVNTHAADNIPNVFARNERVVAIFETSAGPMAIVLVGAMIVGSIETVWAGKITPPHSKKIRSEQYDKVAPIVIGKGEEMGLFKLGSTVITLFPPQTMNWDPTVSLNMDVKMGQKIGTLISRENV
ncbi:MAG TPA: archaetidylserine decarboxylase [Gammaproteobacteria bacterium]|nr:archaetidylserine decarboxylase [Gammaproteobacteria bacterium]